MGLLNSGTLSFFGNLTSFSGKFGSFFRKIEYFLAHLFNKWFRCIEFLGKISPEFSQKAEFFGKKRVFWG